MFKLKGLVYPLRQYRILAKKEVIKHLNLTLT